MFKQAPATIIQTLQRRYQNPKNKTQPDSTQHIRRPYGSASLAAINVSCPTVERVRKRFVNGSLDRALKARPLP